MGLNGAKPQVTSFQTTKRSDPVPHRQHAWYAAYMAALFESNRKQIQERISYAEQLILVRERELVVPANDLTEQRALNHALHALQALASCFDL